MAGTEDGKHRIARFHHPCVECGDEGVAWAAVGGIGDEIFQGVGVDGVVEEFFRHAVLEEVEACGDGGIGFRECDHASVGGGALGGGGHGAGAVGPRVEEVGVVLRDDGTHGVAIATGVFVVFGDDEVAAGLGFTAEDGGETAAVHAGGCGHGDDFEQRGQQIDSGDEMAVVDGGGFRDAGPTHHQWRAGAVEVELGLRERQWHAVVGEENDEGAGVLAGFLERTKNCAEGVVAAADGRVVEGELRAHFGIVGEEAGHGDFGGRIDAARFVDLGLTVLVVERFVGIGDVEVETKRFAGLLRARDAVLG